jgi:ubiquinone/menaquinone biosynthesis C-methylase UbiE
MIGNAGYFEGTGMPDPGWWEALWPDPAGVLAKVGLKPGMDVIDLCSGDGWFTLQIAKIAHHVIAVDLDGKLLDTARTRLAESKQSNCMFIEGNACAVATLVDRQVDFVFLANAFHGVPDKPRLTRAVSKVLKPGGLFVIVNWHERPREETVVLGEPRGPATALRMSPEATNAAVQQAGLKPIHPIEIPPLSLRQRFRENSK